MQIQPQPQWDTRIAPNASIHSQIDWLKPQTIVPASQIILLGASNIALSLPVALRLSTEYWPAPISWWVACGHGRSYGATSRFLGVRSLPGILQCDLWKDWEQERSNFSDQLRLSTAAILTDIGNDLLYDCPPEQLLEWVEQAVCRLSAYTANILLTGLPLDRLQRLSPARYRFFRTLFVPGCRLSLAVIRKRVEWLEPRLAELAERHQVKYSSPMTHWYGIDPIHWQPWVWEEVYRTWFQELAGRPLPMLLRPSDVPTRRRLPPLARLRTARFQFAGRWWQNAQPAARFTDGCVLHLY